MYLDPLVGLEYAIVSLDIHILFLRIWVHDVLDNVASIPLRLLFQTFGDGISGVFGLL